MDSGLLRLIEGLSRLGVGSQSLRSWGRSVRDHLQARFLLATQPLDLAMPGILSGIGGDAGRPLPSLAPGRAGGAVTLAITHHRVDARPSRETRQGSAPVFNPPGSIRVYGEATTRNEKGDTC
jgi:hypothetical protein